MAILLTNIVHRGSVVFLDDVVYVYFGLWSEHTQVPLLFQGSPREVTLEYEVSTRKG